MTDPMQASEAYERAFPRSQPEECYICALGPEDGAESIVYAIEGPRRTVYACTEHYSAVVWASIASGYPKIRLAEIASR